MRQIRLTIFGRLEKEPLECRLRPALFEKTRGRIFDNSLDLPEQSGRRVFQNELGLVFDRNHVAERAFANKPALRENADAVANFLHLSKQMR